MMAPATLACRQRSEGAYTPQGVLLSTESMNSLIKKEEPSGEPKQEKRKSKRHACNLVMQREKNVAPFNTAKQRQVRKKERKRRQKKKRKTKEEAKADDKEEKEDKR